MLVRGDIGLPFSGIFTHPSKTWPTAEVWNQIEGDPFKVAPMLDAHRPLTAERIETTVETAKYKAAAAPREYKDR
jgi:hypothetical protein